MSAAPYDVLVAGCGVAGAAAALTAARAGARVVALDAATPGPVIGESLCGQGVTLLRRMGVLDHARRSAPLENPGDLSCWDSESLVAKDFIFSRHGRGWHLDRASFDAALREAAHATGAVIRRERFRAVRACGGMWEVETDAGVWRARGLLDATGRRSAAARRLGARRMRDAPLAAVFCWGPDQTGDARTVVEAVADGWWYSAPVPGGRRVCVKHVAPAAARDLLRRPGAFPAALRETLHLQRYCPPDAAWTAPRATDASGSALDMNHGERWLAVGDAAATFDPLSAHGILNALAHGLAGAAALLAELDGAVGRSRELDAQLRKKRSGYLQDIISLYAVADRWGSQFYRDMIYENVKNFLRSEADLVPAERDAQP
ncbi:NAD(P)/FAD-dependent oxidoreductase [Camelimonas abortus]|uniref:NAD(P)/FAD-dependent oxidoreductase n=1 Tax=Camelimonas abortus TaxID=1017184 RepID=A0ABV7LIQ3_9HYPH